MKWIKSLAPLREPVAPAPVDVSEPASTPGYYLTDGWPTLDGKAVLPASAIRPPTSPHEAIQ